MSYNPEDLPPHNWRELKEDNKKNGSIIDFIKENIELSIDKPLVSIKYLNTYDPIEDFAYKVKREVNKIFKYYRPVQLERLYLLYFFQGIGGAEIEKTRKKQVIKNIKNIVSKVYIKYFIKEKKEILKLVEWRLHLGK